MVVSNTQSSSSTPTASPIYAARGFAAGQPFATLLDGQKLDDSLFDVVEAGVVRIEDASGLNNVEPMLHMRR